MGFGGAILKGRPGQPTLQLRHCRAEAIQAEVAYFQRYRCLSLTAAQVFEKRVKC